MFNIFITNLGKYNEGELIGEWLELPISEEEIKESLTRIGINEEYEEFFITDYETDITGLTIGEYENIYKLNERAEIIDTLDEYGREKLNALLEYDYSYFSDIEDTISKLDDVSLYSGVNDEEELGYYVIDNGLFGIHIPESLENYIDFESIGRDWSINVSGGFTSYGYVEVCF